MISSKSNNPALLYYDSSNALKFIENELINNITLAEASINHYFGYKNYYLKIEYYNESIISETYEIGNKEHKNNYCSSKEYFINGKLISAVLCLWEDEK